MSAMLQTSTNLKLIDSLAQIILTLSPEERQLLDQKIHVAQTDLNIFFDELSDLQPDLNQPTLEEISQVVREVRQELWTQ
jgi:predicted metal-dependent hydrolase